MKYVCVFLALLAGSYMIGQATAGKPDCPISITPTKWVWVGNSATDCAMPYWGTFHSDGTWDTK